MSDLVEELILDAAIHVSGADKIRLSRALILATLREVQRRNESGVDSCMRTVEKMISEVQKP